MRKFLVLLFIAVSSIKGFSQDFSNKGREFWITSGYHYSMASGTPPVMTLSLTSDVNTTYQVEAYGGGVIAIGNITANQVTNVNIPSAYYTTGNGLFNNKAIHVTSAQPIVVYSFVTQSLASAATLCLPANVLGKQYYSANYTQNSNSGNSNGFITVIAIEDNTTVEIIPTNPTAGGWAANSINTITLNKGQTYQVLGALISANVGYDLTGSSVRSIASGTGGCKRIAVFSGSGRVLIGGGCTNGADNLYQQLYPAASWGRKYLTVPSADKPTNYYRIMRTSPTANVFLNGTLIPPGAFTNNYYEFFNNFPNMIEADTSICVVQYFTSAGCIAGNANPYDPDMVVLNPVEQNISDVTLISSDRLTHTPTPPQHHIHVIMKNSGTAISSFRFDGLPVTGTAVWVPHPSDPTYSYLYLKNVSETYHSLKSDSGFNAVAYGYANNETYAYSAGTNVKDLYSTVGTSSQYGIDPGAICQGTPFKFKLSLPYRPDSIYWDLSGIPNTPQYGIEKLLQTVPTIPPNYDSITTVNGKTLYWFALPNFYTFSNPGIYVIPITVFAPNADGCGNQDEKSMTIEVTAPPLTDFSWFNPGCPAETVSFNDQTTSTKPTYIWNWTFGDPTSPNNTSALKNPTHLFTGPGTFPVTYSNITTAGCVSTPATYNVIVPDFPNATISGSTSICVNATSPSITITGTAGQAPYEFIYDINGGAPITVTSNAAGIYVINNVPTNANATITLHSVRNISSAVCSKNITGQVATVTVNPFATLAYQSGATNQTVCVNSAIGNITYTVASGGTGATITGLPPGVTGSFAGGVFTIAGAPTTAVGSPFTYTILPAGPCLDPTVPGLTGTITVNDIATISLQSANATQSPCINTAIGNIIYQVGGGATGVTVSGLPPGVNYVFTAGNPFSTVTISGTPTSTAGSPYNYSISTVSNCTNPPPLAGSITVKPDATIGLTSAPATTAQTKCVNNAINNITYAIDGTVTSVTVNNLPPGVNYIYTPGTPGNLTISGTPTSSVGSPYNYSVVIAGPCQLPAVQSGTLTVTPDATISLFAGSSTPTVCVNTAITNIVYQIFGAVTAVNVTGLPAGVTSAYVPGNPGTLTILGSPTVVGPALYSITITGPCQVPAPIGGTITTTADATLTLNSALATTDQTVCVNTPITQVLYTFAGSATGAIVSGTLPPGVTVTATATTISIAGTPTVVSNVPMVYNYTIVTQGPCAVPSATGKITVNPDHKLTLTSNAATENQSVCNSSQIAPVTYTFDGGATGVTVTGLPAAGLNYTITGNTVTITGAPTATVNYTIKTTGNACQIAQRGGIITMVPLPTPNFSYTAPSCNTRTVGFNDNSIPNSGALSTWSWNFGDGSPVSNNQNPTHTYTNPGPYSVQLTVTTAPNGCSNVITLPVVINERPKTEFTFPATAVCINDVVLFTDASTSPVTNAPFNVNGYKWDFGDVINNTQNTKNGTHQFSAGGTYTVTHISESAAGCKDTVTHTINIASAPVANFSVSGTGPLCVNDTVSIINLSSIGVGAIAKVEVYWDYLNAPGAFDVYNSPVLNAVYKHKYPNFQTPGTKPYTVVVRAYSGISCTNDKLTVITLNAVPKVQFNAMPDACYFATPFQITQASEIGGVAGTGVYSGTGVSATGIFNPVTAGVGTHTIKYTYTSVAGCVDTMSSTIKVLDTASAKFSYVTPVCDGSPIIFKEESTAPAGVTLNNTIWDFNDGSPAEQHLPGTTFTHTFPIWNTYNVTMHNTSVYGCKSSDIITAIRVNPIPSAVFNFVQTSVCLPNAAVSMVNTSSIADNSAITYMWDFGDGLGPLSSSSAKTPPPHTYSGVGPYTVTLTVKGAVGTNGACQQVVTHPVNFIHPQPKAAFDFSKPQVCIGGDVIVTDRTNGLDGTVQQWFWDFGDAITASSPQVQHLYTVANIYNVSLYIVNSQGCNSDTLTQPFAVNSYPVVDAGPDRVVLEGGAVTMQPVVTGNDLQYLWSPATYLNSTTEAAPIANNILDDITYTLTVTGRGGCTAPSDKMFIKVLKAPKIPNTFTPNGDGINETWLIDYLDTYPNCKVQVFTRTGQVVFESKGYKVPWNGTIGGKPLPFDTYYYIIEPGNGRAPMTGYVTIIK